jgi:hypothetical protein
VKSISFHLKIEHLWGLAALVGIFVFVNTHPIRPQDFWWHITIGRQIVSTGQIPATDIYSYTAGGQAYPSYQMFWLMEIVLYALYHLGGPALVVFAHSLWITLSYVVLFWLSKQASQSWRTAAFCVLLAAALGLNDWNVRPQGITFLLGSLYLMAIYQYRRQSRWYWLVIFPLGMLVWVNSHGTFLIGLVLIALWWGQDLWEAFIHRVRGQKVKTLKPLVMGGGILALTTLVCLLNPRGIGIVDYLRTLTGNPVVQNLVVEWAAPTFHTYLGIAFFICLFIFALLLVFSPKRPSFFQIATLVIFGSLGVKTSRGIVWFGLVMAPIVGEHLGEMIRRFQVSSQRLTKGEGSRLINLIFVSVILLMGFISLPWFKSYLPLPPAKAGLISTETPIKATQFLLEANPPGRLFNSISFGSYLIWAAYPQYQVFVDTRIELFPEKVWMDYLNVSNAVGAWETTLLDYGVNTLMLNTVEQAPLIQAVQASPDWQLLYSDSTAYIYLRSLYSP